MNPEKQWAYPRRQPDEQQEREIIGRVAEIGLRIIFEHFTYRFGGEYYKQMKGGPIGARVTMAASRLVMQSWSEAYKEILTNSGLEVDWLNGYVDDGRQASSVFKLGMRFQPESMLFEHSAEAEAEDIELDESSDRRMARICLPAMNHVNKDLIFTVEVPEDFPGNRLPTLDFQIWLKSSTR